MVAVRLAANGGSRGRREVGVIAGITILVVVMIMVMIILIMVMVVIMVVGGGSGRSDSSAIYGSRLGDMALTVYQHSKSAVVSYRATTLRMHER